MLNSVNSANYETVMYIDLYSVNVLLHTENKVNYLHFNTSGRYSKINEIPMTIGTGLP